MHRVLNIKHRVVRRIEPGKAPLATFDIVDLGDEDTKPSFAKRINHSGPNKKQALISSSVLSTKLIKNEPVKSETIGGNNSKKPLSQTGGEDKDKKNADASKDQDNSKESREQTTGREAAQTRPPSTDLAGSSDALENERHEITENPPEGSGRNPPSSSSSSSSSPTSSPAKEIGKESSKSNAQTTSSPACLSRQGTLGRVNIPIKKQDSESSSSSESCNELHFTFTATRPSIAHLDSADAGDRHPDYPHDKDTQLNLRPDLVDPSQILSPSKRKAYEKRLERLKVTTSPIARPRSTAPISVVTLDDYANISSPEASPASPSVLQDKLKITLPSDEFAVRPKTPKAQHAKRRDSDDACFEFSEEILFRRTKSALVVNEDGHIPLSPRRVLIPPTITPTTSPQLSPAPRLASSLFHEETASTSTATAPKLIYIQNEKSAKKFFGETVDEGENENWADFPDNSALNIEKADSERQEKEDLKTDSVVLPRDKPPGQASSSVCHVVSNSKVDSTDDICTQGLPHRLGASDDLELPPPLHDICAETKPTHAVVPPQDDVVICESEPTQRSETISANTATENTPRRVGVETKLANELSLETDDSGCSELTAEEEDTVLEEKEEVLMVEIVKSDDYCEPATIGIGVKANNIDITEPVHFAWQQKENTLHSSENSEDCLLEFSNLEANTDPDLSFPSTETLINQDSHLGQTSLLDEPILLNTPTLDAVDVGAVLQPSVAFQPEVPSLTPKSTSDPSTFIPPAEPLFFDQSVADFISASNHPLDPFPALETECFHGQGHSNAVATPDVPVLSSPEDCHVSASILD